ncbi:DedA family protein [Halobacteriovorax vibrionivorans]|uniref:DedA family protein n=1 Tax=Halobacteriovorax vibrionivorans TaxID=2152716 RepID=A0ABY0IFJ4_9BACT|nr:MULTISPECIES: YqaA family protein [Halobacteriovorax]RZF21275.1 DedA family protein [Halobacteriovorax vibrionivorans]TGD47967.1 DedA family protein [Halobacteriovorax sp. Y22]
MDLIQEYGVFGLFLISFAAATILPFSSEVFLFSAVKLGLPKTSIFLAASFGNFLGGVSCYYLGHLGKLSWCEKFFKISKEKVLNLQHHIQRFGTLLASLTWMPIIGDPMAVALGYFRCRVAPTFIMMFIGKALRYVFVIWLANEL